MIDSRQVKQKRWQVTEMNGDEKLDETRQVNEMNNQAIISAKIIILLALLISP